MADYILGREKGMLLLSILFILIAIFFLLKDFEVSLILISAALIISFFIYPSNGKIAITKVAAALIIYLATSWMLALHLEGESLVALMVYNLWASPIFFTYLLIVILSAILLKKEKKFPTHLYITLALVCIIFYIVVTSYLQNPDIIIFPENIISRNGF